MNYQDMFSNRLDKLKAEGNYRVFAELERQEIHVLSMRNKTNRLEELFMGLVQQGNQTKEVVG